MSTPGGSPSLGSWSSSRPSLVVAPLVLLAGVATDVLQLLLSGQRPQPRFADLPWAYLLATAWLLYKMRGEPRLLQVLLASLAGGFLILALGAAGQARPEIWTASRLLTVVSAV